MTVQWSLDLLAANQKLFYKHKVWKASCFMNKGVATMVHATRGQLWHLKLLTPGPHAGIASL